MIQDSCVLIGVVDETGLLEEDEVYVQLRRDNFTKKNIKDFWDLNTQGFDETKETI